MMKTMQKLSVTKPLGWPRAFQFQGSAAFDVRGTRGCHMLSWEDLL